MWGYYRDFRDADRYKAIVDGNNGRMFSIISKDYRLIRHKQATEEIEAFFYRAENLGSPSITTEFYNEGAECVERIGLPPSKSRSSPEI